MFASDFSLPLGGMAFCAALRARSSMLPVNSTFAFLVDRADPDGCFLRPDRFADGLRVFPMIVANKIFAFHCVKTAACQSATLISTKSSIPSESASRDSIII